MFWKKKPKEDKNAAPPPPARAEARPEPRPPEAQRAPPPAQPRAQPAAPSGGDQRAQLVAALARRAGPLAAPMTVETLDAQKRALDVLLADTSLQGVVRDIAAGQTDAAFAALELHASGARNADMWRHAGAVMYGVDGPRARKAYEQSFAVDPRHFWGAIFVARLRALSQDINGANDAASAAILAAQTPDERGVAFFEAALISMAREDYEAVVVHGAHAIEASRASIKAGARDALALRDFVARLSLVADANVARQNYAAAQSHYAEALVGARKLAQAAGGAAAVQRGVAELLEKSASIASGATDHELALHFAEEAVAIRRSILSDPNDSGAYSALASALNSLGEVRRILGQTVVAKTTFKDAIENARTALSLNPSDPTARRDVWLALWRLASMDGGGISWRQVADAMETVAASGGLNPKHQHFLDEARRRAAAT
ncbi:MAG: hypothetical protein SGJ23_04735 [Alphaproteobacteria bacterium]|nr:hypothetical protein [Alphaproteobacteria bacterium]